MFSCLDRNEEPQVSETKANQPTITRWTGKGVLLGRGTCRHSKRRTTRDREDEPEVVGFPTTRPVFLTPHNIGIRRPSSSTVCYPSEYFDLSPSSYIPQSESSLPVPYLLENFTEEESRLESTHNRRPSRRRFD